MRFRPRVAARAQRFTRSTALLVPRIFSRRHRRRTRRVASNRLDRARRQTDSATGRIWNNSALNRFLVTRSAHFHRSSAGAVIAPVTFVAFEPFARAATIAHENVGLSFLVPRKYSHSFY